MNSKAIVISGLCLSVAVASVGFSLKSGIERFVDRDRTVTVKGLSEREVLADTVIWPIVFRVTGDNLSQLNTEADKQVVLIKRYLETNGIDPKTITLGTPNVTDTHMEYYGNARPPERYRLEGTVVVAGNQVDAVREAQAGQSALIGQGVLVRPSYNMQYLFNGLNEIKPVMIEEATQNARVTAQKFADDSGSQLGKIRRASQGQFSVNDRDHNTPHVKKVRIVTTVEYYLKD